MGSVQTGHGGESEATEIRWSAGMIIAVVILYAAFCISIGISLA